MQTHKTLPLTFAATVAKDAEALVALRIAAMRESLRAHWAL